MNGLLQNSHLIKLNALCTLLLKKANSQENLKHGEEGGDD